MTQRFELGEMDDDALVPWTKIPPSVNSPAHQQLALDMGRETMTLLQNNNNMLPLSKTGQKIAVVGPNADDATMLWGNYNGTPFRTTTILEGIKSKVSAGQLIYDKGCDLTEDKITETAIPYSTANSKAGITAAYWTNGDWQGSPSVTEQINSPMALTTFGQHQFAPGIPLEGFSAKYETTYKPNFSGEIVFKLEATGAADLLVNGKSLIKTNNWRSTPSKIPFQVEAGKEYKIELQYKQLNNWAANLKFDFGKEVPVSYDALLTKVKDADVVIFVGGISPKLEGEEMPVQLPGFKGGDRTDIELPAVQRSCIKALKDAGKKVVFVNCSGSAIAMVPETQNCDAILQAWYGGESGGQAVADVLFGDYNPSGHLPVTFYKSTQQLPDFSDYSMKGRTYRYMKEDPLFPFGYGLSYTTFNIGEARMSKKIINKTEGVELTVPVANTGKRKGVEVLQVYIRKTSDADGPNKTLKAFKRVSLMPGQTEMVTVNLSPKSFETFDTLNGGLSVTPGDYEVFYGSSSAAKDLKSLQITIR
jgi:beta-glucosidase